MNQERSNKFRELSRTRWQRLFEIYQRFNSKVYLTEFGASVAISLLLVLMVHHNPGMGEVLVIKAGELAPRTIRSPKTVELQDVEESDSLRLEVLKKVVPVYDHDVDAVDSWTENWNVAMREMRDQGAQLQENPRRSLSKKLGVDVGPEDFAVLEKLAFSKELEHSIAYTLGPLWGQKIMDDSSIGASPIDVIQLRNNKSERLTNLQAKSIMNVEEARKHVLEVVRAATQKVQSAGGGKRVVGRRSDSRRSEDHRSDGRRSDGRRSDGRRMPWLAWTEKQRDAVFRLQAEMIQPTVTLNRKETESRREDELKKFQPIVLRLQKNEVIVREGEKVSAKASRVLAQLKGSEIRDPYLRRLPFETFFGAFSIWMVIVFLRRQYPTVLKNPKDSYVLAGGLLTSLAVFKLVAIFLVNILGDQFYSLPGEFFLFLIPVAAPAMMVRLLLKPINAVLFSVFFAVGCALIFEGAMAFGIHVLICCLMGGTFLKRCRTRTELYKAGIRTAVVSGFSAVAIVGAWGGQAPLSSSVFSVHTSVHFNPLILALWAFVGGLVGGWLSSALTLMLTPPLENVLDYTTDLKLLELARMDHPLLRELVLKAPGTYHHSIVVGSLAEAACEAIGANSLMARVGSYYHDIGKIHRADYFVENQTHGENPHDHTRPQLSAKIIISHVKEGRVLAEQHKLGQHISDFILQHHGTSLVSYFFNKAKQEAAQPGSNTRPEDINEEEFRYPGPRPQSKEAAVMALADGCEASTRSLVDPTPARIEGMIHKIIGKALADGLLDDADITLREIHLVERAFLRILLGIHHNRIQYPDQEKDLPKAQTISFSKTSTDR